MPRVIRDLPGVVGGAKKPHGRGHRYRIMLEGESRVWTAIYPSDPQSLLNTYPRRRWPRMVPGNLTSVYKYSFFVWVLALVGVQSWEVVDHLFHMYKQTNMID